MRASWSLIALALVACEKDKAQDPPKDPAPRVVAVDAAPAAPAIDAAPKAAVSDAAAAACGVRYALTTKADGARTIVTATATNLGAAGISIEVADRCPRAPFALHGLPTGYDPDGACLEGACPPEEESRPVNFDVDPGATVTLSAWTIDPGKTACNEPLPAGRYALTFDAVAPVGGGATCGPDPVVLEIVAAKPAPKRTPTHGKPAATPAPYKCPKMPACGIGCPGDMAHDEHGCTLCACEDDRGPLDKHRM